MLRRSSALTFPVYIEAGDIPQEAREVGVLLAACSAALRDKPCVLGRRKSGREPQRASVVMRGPNAEEIAIDVALDELASQRELRFDERDATTERWRAAGLVVASLVLLSGRKLAPAAQPENASNIPLGPSPIQRLSTSSPTFGVWASASAGSWAPHSPLLLGGELGVEAFPLSAPIGLCLRGEASQALAKLERSVSVSRLLLAVGIVTSFPERTRLRLVLRGQLARERLFATAQKDSGENDKGSTLRTAGILALSPTFTIDKRLSAHVGAQVTLYDGEPKVRVAETIVAQASRVVASGFVGIRLGF